ncbi:MAG: CBS domain-containing protein [Verrucomicrobiales bacterium]|jgi:CBS domain-containing protein
MRVEDILEKKGRSVATLSKNAQVSDAVTALYKHGIGAVVVSADGSAIEGILSERDIVRELHRTGATVLYRSIADIMTKKVITCAPNDEVDQLMGLMTENKIRHLPVAEDGVLVGIISTRDVVAMRVDELLAETKAKEDSA